MATAFIGNAAAAGSDLISSSSTSLFVGDLPKYCTEADLEQLFNAFGCVIDIKIKRNMNEGRTLTFAFVTFTQFEAAEAARLRLDGYLFMGRRLRIRWAVQNAKPFELEPGSVVNSVYFRFSTSRLDRTICDFDLHRVFSTVGQVDDVSIKESFIDHRMGRQCGYGFVHFPPGREGVAMALQAVSTLHNQTLDHITLSVELSRNLLKQFGGQGGNLGQKGGARGGIRGASGAYVPSHPAAHAPMHAHSSAAFAPPRSTYPTPAQSTYPSYPEYNTPREAIRSYPYHTPAPAPTSAPAFYPSSTSSLASAPATDFFGRGDAYDPYASAHPLPSLNAHAPMPPAAPLGGRSWSLHTDSLPAPSQDTFSSAALPLSSGLFSSVHAHTDVPALPIQSLNVPAPAGSSSLLDMWAVRGGESVEGAPTDSGRTDNSASSSPASPSSLPPIGPPSRKSPNMSSLSPPELDSPRSLGNKVMGGGGVDFGELSAALNSLSVR